MRRQGLLVALAVIVACTSYGAGLTCGLTATPQTIAGEGLAEQTGDILLRCSGGTPAGMVSGTVYIALSRRVANRIVEDVFQSITVSQDVMGVWIPIAGAKPRPYNYGVQIEAVKLTLDLGGSFALKISGIRTEAGAPVNALIQFIASEQIQIMTPQVTVAAGTPSLFATLLGTVASPCNGPLPGNPDFMSVTALHLPVTTTRVTEGWGEAFRARRAGENQGTRFIVRFSNVPKGAKLLAPDAVAGSSATIPTSSGMMGTPATGGMYTSTTQGQLLLARVRNADEKGNGGIPFVVPAPGPQLLVSVNEADWGTSGPHVVYEVMDSIPVEFENAQIPVWVWFPPEWPNNPVMIHPMVYLAPLSEEPGPEGGAIPRFRPVTPASDCQRVGDCSASYYPRMLVTPSGDTNFTAASGGPAKAGYILVHNVGGNVLEWSVSLRYKQGRDWISFSPSAGYNNATVAFNVIPKDLEPGRYEAEFAFKQYGVAAEQTIVVTLTVTPKPADPPKPPEPPRPPEPPATLPPSITEVLSAGSLLPGPLAPGALMVIRGTRLDENTQVTVRQTAALVVLAAGGELVAEVPPNLEPAGKANVVVSSSGAKSLPYDVELTPVWPATLFVLNEDGERNSEELAATTGKEIEVFVTGVRLAAGALEVLLHDRKILAQPEPAEQPGVTLVKVTVPEDLPAMMTAVRVCGAAGEVKACSHPKDIWLKRP